MSRHSFCSSRQLLLLLLVHNVNGDESVSAARPSRRHPAAATKEPTEEPLRLKLLSRVINGLVSWGGVEMRPESCVFLLFCEGRVIFTGGLNSFIRPEWTSSHYLHPAVCAVQGALVSVCVCRAVI